MTTPPNPSNLPLYADLYTLDETLRRLVYTLGDIYQTQEVVKAIGKGRRRALVCNLKELAMKLNCDLEED